MSGNRETVVRSSGEIVKQGYLKKLKPSKLTMRKKYFVLRGDSPEAPARLEYYDSEKKFKLNQPPKRSITLKSCFNINKRTDIKNKCVIALYMNNDRFCIVLQTEEEVQDWLKSLLELQSSEPISEGAPVKPNFEHVWQVTVLSKELGGKTGILGPYFFCLTDQTLSLVKIGEDKTDPVEFSLQKIRRCGFMDNFVYMEVGHYTVTGAGNLWMEAEDSYMAENIYRITFKYFQSACGSRPKKDLQPKSRTRSSSANEASKPTSLQKWPTHSASSGSSGGVSQRTFSFPISPIPPARRASTGTRPTKFITSTSPKSSLTSGLRERSDSMPSRPRTTSEPAAHFPHPQRTLIPSSQHRTYNRVVNQSPPVASSPVSPGSGAGSTDSAGSSLSMEDTVDGQWDDRCNQPLTPDDSAIPEENTDDYGHWPAEDEKLNNYVHNVGSSYGLVPMNTINLRKHSPHQFSGFKSSSPSQSSYMDMNSPCGSSPMEPGNYMPMSPGENRGVTNNRPVISHSRGSSLTEDGYVPMAPGASDDGYVNMDHGQNQNRRDHYQSGDLSTGSSCSVTSGTPSTDIRFSDYRLDKVSTYFPADEEIVPAERPARAYSVGSRPTLNKNRSDLTSGSYERTRAFSVGSKVKSSFRAPMQHMALSSSHSSMEPSDDLMEMDFTKKGRSNAKNRKKPSSSERLSVPGGSASTLSSAASSYSTAEGSYMDMSPRGSPSLAPSPPKNHRLISIFGKSPPKCDLYPFNRNSPPVSGYPSPSLGRVLETEPGYVEMNTEYSYIPYSPPNAKPRDAYMEMRPGQPETKQVVAKNTRVRVDSFPSADSHPVRKSSFGLAPLAKPEDLSLKRKLPQVEDNNNSKVVVGQSPPKSHTDDYVEMSLGVQRKEEERDYMNMGKKPECRYSSQPITIQSSKDLSHNPVYSLAGRKHSTGTPPKVPTFLPLGSASSPVSSPFSTLGRARRNMRRDSRDKTTPIGSSTIFPMNLTSPTNSPDIYEESAKCPVDATSGTVRLSYDSSHSDEDTASKLKSCEGEDDPGDYVNYEPGPIDTSDYALMQPGSNPPSRKTSTSRPMEKLLTDLGRKFCSLSVMTSSSGSAARSEAQGKDEEDDEARRDESPGKSSSRKELHYASLDLVRSGSESEDSNLTLKTQTSLTESSTSSPSPNPTTDSSFNYAEIDFAKSGSSHKTIH